MHENHDQHTVATEKNWKCLLLETYTKHVQRALTKSEIAYSTIGAPDGGFVGSVCCGGFANEYQAEVSKPSKKLAEQAAAEVAFRHEFADLY